MVAVLATGGVIAGAEAAEWEVVETAGSVRHRAPGEALWWQVTADSALPAESQIVTDQSGWVVIARAKERINIGPNARLLLPAESGLNRLWQDRGRLTYQSDAASARRLEIETPYASLIAKGTTFEVALQPGELLVEVEHGLVELVTRDASARVELGVGQAARVRAGERLLLEVRWAPGQPFQPLTSQPPATVHAPARDYLAAIDGNGGGRSYAAPASPGEGSASRPGGPSPGDPSPDGPSPGDPGGSDPAPGSGPGSDGRSGGSGVGGAPGGSHSGTPGTDRSAGTDGGLGQGVGGPGSPGRGDRGGRDGGGPGFGGPGFGGPGFGGAPGSSHSGTRGADRSAAAEGGFGQGVGGPGRGDHGGRGGRDGNGGDRGRGGDRGESGGRDGAGGKGGGGGGKGGDGGKGGGGGHGGGGGKGGGGGGQGGGGGKGR